MDIFRFIGLALLPAIASIIFLLLKKKCNFWKNLNFPQQLCIGICFGALSILGNTYGLYLEKADAIVCTRDAAPICAGLFFGGWAGFTAGLLGGIERFITSFWGIGVHTRIPSALGTLCVGLFAGLLHHYFFKRKSPGFLFSIILAFVLEIFHITLLFILESSDILRISTIAHASILPMGASASFAACVTSVIFKIFNRYQPTDDVSRSSTAKSIQYKFCALFILSLIGSYALNNATQNAFIKITAERVILASSKDLQADIKTFLEKSPEQLHRVCNHWKVSTTGYQLLIDKNTNLVISDDTGANVGRRIESFGITPPFNTDITVEMSVDRDHCFVRSFSIDHFQGFTILPMNNFTETSKTMLLLEQFCNILIFTLVFLLIFLLIQKNINFLASSSQSSSDEDN